MKTLFQLLMSILSLSSPQYFYWVLCLFGVSVHTCVPASSFSPHSPPLPAHPVAPAGPPVNLEAVVASPHSVQLHWDPPSPPPLGGVVYYINWGEDPANLDKVYITMMTNSQHIFGKLVSKRVKCDLLTKCYVRYV